MDDSMASTMANYYNSIYNSGASVIKSQGQQAEKKNRAAMAAMGTGGGGSAVRGMMEGNDKNTQNALSSFLSATKGQEAQAVGQGMVMDKQRQWQNEDFIKNIGTNLLSSFLAGPIKGISAGTSTAIASAINPNWATQEGQAAGSTTNNYNYAGYSTATPQP